MIKLQRRVVIAAAIIFRGQAKEGPGMLAIDFHCPLKHCPEFHATNVAYGYGFASFDVVRIAPEQDGIIV